MSRNEQERDTDFSNGRDWFESVTELMYFLIYAIRAISLHPCTNIFAHFPPRRAVTGSMREASSAGYSAASRVTINAIKVRLMVSLRVR